MSSNIFLNIDTIVLHGLRHIDRHALAEALKKALSEQLSQKRELRGVELSRVTTTLSLPDNFAAEQLGVHLAQSLSGVISGDGTCPRADREPFRGGGRDA